MEFPSDIERKFVVVPTKTASKWAFSWYSASLRNVGHYLYLDTSNSNGKASTLTTPVYSPAAGGCSLEFWYFIKPAGQSALAVYVKEEGMSGNGRRIWIGQNGADQGWVKGTASLLSISKPYQVSIACDDNWLAIRWKMSNLMELE